MSGNYLLEALGTTAGGSIVNRGLISASTGGVTLVSDSGVINEGTILATLGDINLSTTSKATIDFDGDKLLKLTVQGEVLQNV